MDVGNGERVADLKNESIVVIAVTDVAVDVSKNLSKNQLKKLKRKEKWLQGKGQKRLKERAKAKERRAVARINNVDLGPSRKALKKSTMANSTCKLTVTIDMSFDELMIDKDIAKLIKQILRCYTLNRRAVAPMQFSLTSFNDRSKQEMAKHNGYDHWDVNFYSETYLNVYPRDKIIYLTSESDNVIENLEHDCVYVIGGLVDHNSQKGVCYRLAVKDGVRHGQLPLDKFLLMSARKVLTIDHVFEILLRVTEGKTWQEAFLQVLPGRKNAQPVLKSSRNSTDDSESIEKDVNIRNKVSRDQCSEHENEEESEIRYKINNHEKEQEETMQIVTEN